MALVLQECENHGLALPPLVRRNLSANFAAMMRWSAKQVFVIVLAFLLTASMGLSVVQAATFMPEPANMSMMSGMDNSTDHGCKQCIGDMNGKTMVCAPVCVAIVASAQSVVVLHDDEQKLFFTAFDIWLKDQSPVPDPYPPRTSNIV